MYSYAMDNWTLEAILRLLLAGVLGAAIGTEREHHGRSAGLRTHLLASLGAALAITVSLHFARVFSASSTADTIRIDPARIAYGIMVGIGFLGAGAMVRYGRGIRGLTTAASLWCTAAVGMACGFGMYVIAAVTTVIVLFALIVLSRLEQHIPARRSRIVTLGLPLTGDDVVSRIRGILKSHSISIAHAEHIRDFERDREMVTLHVRMSTRTGDGVLLKLKDELPELLRISVR